jgi:hypothetical protein
MDGESVAQSVRGDRLGEVSPVTHGSTASAATRSRRARVRRMRCFRRRVADLSRPLCYLSDDGYPELEITEWPRERWYVR